MSTASPIRPAIAASCASGSIRRTPPGPISWSRRSSLRGESAAGRLGCDGTTGYDFMDEVSALQHDPAGERRVAAAWAALSGRPADFATEEASGAPRDHRAQLLRPARSLRRAHSIAGRRQRPQPTRAAPRADRDAGAFPGLSQLRHRRRRRRSTARCCSRRPTAREGPACRPTAGLIDAARMRLLTAHAGHARPRRASSN